MSPIRIQRSRAKGWKMPADTVIVSRPSRYGNPFRVGRDGTAEECVAKFRAHWERALEIAQMPPRSPPMPFNNPIFLGPLVGKNLACWCALDQPCHADVLLDIVGRIACTEATRDGREALATPGRWP